MDIHYTAIVHSSEDDKMFYTFWIHKQKVPKNKELKFVSKYLVPEIPHEDVVDILFSKCKMKSVPQGLTAIFPNLKSLKIWDSNLKDVLKSELMEYKNFEVFDFRRNKVKSLEKFLFVDFKNLREIHFQRNKLKVISPFLLYGSNNLVHVDLRNNPNYDEYYSCLLEMESDLTLDDLKFNLLKKFLDNPKNATETIFQYAQMCKDYKESLDDIRQEIQVLRIENQELMGELEEATSEIPQDIQSDIKHFLHDEKSKDFKIMIDDQEFSVHKFLLAARSPTLAEVLQNNPHVENLNLVDIPVDIFKVILNFLYTDKFPNEDTNFLQLFAAAGRLKLDNLKNFAADKILQNINEDNVIDVLNLSNKYGDDELRMDAFEMIKELYPNINFMDEWAFEPQRITKVIELFKEKEEAIRKIEENYKESIDKN